MSAVKSILLVCTGNSCRSVMAGGLLKKMLKGKGDYSIMTAGTHALRGMRATNEAIQVMFEQKIDVSNHRSSTLSDKMIRQADLILVMEQAHKEDVLRRAPNARGRVQLLSELDIPDPIGRSVGFYRKVFNIIRQGLERVVKNLEEE